MRQIGCTDTPEHARILSGYLYVSGIQNQIEQAPDGRWAVWIHRDEDLEQARHLLAKFLESPDDPQYARIAAEAPSRRQEEEGADEQARERHIEIGKQWRGSTLLFGRIGALTLALMIVSVAVAFLSGLGAKDQDEMLQSLFITRYRIEPHGGQQFVAWQRGLPEVRHGEVWRMVTPIFIHFGVLHILFNMLWLKDLGSLIESRQRWWVLLALVLATGAASNLAQYAWSGPNFGGMSGVVYGLLGYVWLRGRFDPRSAYRLDKGTVVMMIVWLLLCMTGAIGHVANAAHAAGLGVGCGWGFLSSGWIVRRLRGH